MAVVVVLGAVIWFGYPRGVGPGWVSNNGWQLDALSIDGTTLTVSTNFGGVASGCARFEEWTWSESDDRVDIEARLWEAIAPQACTADGASESVTIELLQPLGDRDLTGCGEPECLPTIARAGQFVIDALDANDEGVAAIVSAPNGGSALVHLSPDGTGRVPNLDPTHGTPSRIRLTAEVGVVQFDRKVVATDPSVATEWWETEGFVVGVDHDHVYLCVPEVVGEVEEETGSVVALTPETGQRAWTVEGPCAEPVRHGDLLTFVTHDPMVDGGHLLFTVDATSGTERSRRVLDDGIDDRVIGIDAVVALGDRTIAAGVQSDVIVLDSTGVETARYPWRTGTPLTAIDGVLVVDGSPGLVALDVDRQADIWATDNTNIVAIDGAIFELAATDGVVARLDPSTGNTRWQAEVGLTNAIRVAVDGDVAYVATNLAVIAMDVATGEILWVEPLG